MTPSSPAPSPARAEGGPAPDEADPGRDAPELVLFFSQYDGLRPTTNPIADRRFCAGLAALGSRVELVVPYVFRRTNLPRSMRPTAYGEDPPVPVRRMPTPLLESFDRWNVPVLMLFVALAYARTVLRHRADLRRMVVVSRDPNCLLPVLLINRLLGERRSRVVLWAHEHRSDRGRFRLVHHRIDALLATNGAIIEAWRAEGLPPKPVALTSNPIPAGYLSSEPSRAAARRQLALEGEAPLVVYTGKLGTGLREIDHLLEAARLLPECRFLLTGGKRSVVAELKRRCESAGIENVAFTGLLPEVGTARLYQRAADVVVSYYSSADHEVRFNLPQKIPEYMASRAVIVTPDHPATREVLNAGNAILVEPEDARALAAGIREAIKDPERAAALADRAYRDAHELTIEARAVPVARLLASLAG